MMLSMMAAGIASEHYSPRTIGVRGRDAQRTHGDLLGPGECIRRLPEPSFGGRSAEEVEVHGEPTGVDHGIFDGKVVLVTGAAKRIGRGIALRLRARRRARADSLQTLRRTRLAQDGGRMRGAPHISRESRMCRDIESMFRRRCESELGRLDGLVNNAARFTRFDPMDITEADWDFIHTVNLKATFFCCQQGAQTHAGERGGRIVNISSLGGIRPWAEHVHYCASKAGVIMLTKALAEGPRAGNQRELRGSGSDSVRRDGRRDACKMVRQDAGRASRNGR